ncbi:MAG: autoinducer binding domain-containing protein [Burkholderiales bacterium]
MLRAVTPDSPGVALRIVPPIAAPLVAAHAQGVPLAPVLQSITNELRFDHFLYGVSSTSIPDAASRAFAWTSLPEDWLREYEVARYIELDPRLRGARESTLPFLWDARTCAHTAAERAFFAAAARHGVCSGVAIALRHRCDAPGIFMLSSAAPVNDDARREHIASVLGPAMALATAVHDIALQGLAAFAAPAGACLTPRERECLQLAARGLTSRAIGATLGIGERTVHTHFANLIVKLEVSNRQEAIAKATASGLIACPPRC